MKLCIDCRHHEEIDSVHNCWKRANKVDSDRIDCVTGKPIPDLCRDMRRDDRCGPHPVRCGREAVWFEPKEIAV